jgi:hypothetical protein
MRRTEGGSCPAHEPTKLTEAAGMVAFVRVGRGWVVYYGARHILTQPRGAEEGSAAQAGRLCAGKGKQRQGEGIVEVQSQEMSWLALVFRMDVDG